MKMTPTCPESEGHAELSPLPACFCQLNAARLSHSTCFAWRAALHSWVVFLDAEEARLKKRGKNVLFLLDGRLLLYSLSLRRPVFFSPPRQAVKNVCVASVTGSR